MTKSPKLAPGAGPDVVGKRQCNRWTAERRVIFFETLGQTANVERSARACGMSAAAVYLRRKRDAVFAADWRDALEQGYCEVELSLLRQSIEGTDTTKVRTGADATRNYTEVTHSYPFATALQMLRLHRAEVEGIRRERANEAARGQADEDVFAEMNRIRALLLGRSAAPEVDGPVQAEREEDNEGMAHGLRD